MECPENARNFPICADKRLPYQPRPADPSQTERKRQHPHHRNLLPHPPVPGKRHHGIPGRRNRPATGRLGTPISKIVRLALGFFFALKHLIFQLKIGQNYCIMGMIIHTGQLHALRFYEQIVSCKSSREAERCI